MDAAADRPEFAPPPERGLLRGFALAVLAHLLLVAALTYGLRWQRETHDAAVEAELWSALPQQAAPKEEPTPPAPAPPPPQPQPQPQPTVKAPPAPEPPVKSQADIAMEREKQKRLEQQRREAELEKERREAELEKKREQELAKKKREQELAKKKQEQQKLLAEAKRKEEEKKRKQQEQEERDAKRLAQQREENLKRIQGMAGGTGAPSSQGTAARSTGPSASWAGRVQAKVRPHIVFADNVPGNPQAVVEVRLGPGGMILGKPRLVRSSGHPSWDEAVIRALERAESLPPDTDGRYPSPVEISFKPKA